MARTGEKQAHIFSAALPQNKTLGGRAAEPHVRQNRIFIYLFQHVIKVGKAVAKNIAGAAAEARGE